MNNYGRTALPYDDVMYGDAESWGGPQDGVDILQGIEGTATKKKSAAIAKDTYTFIIIVIALALLWVMGGTIFRNARI